MEHNTERSQAQPENTSNLVDDATEVFLEPELAEELAMWQAAGAHALSLFPWNEEDTAYDNELGMND
jgi:hypothetical protein